MILAIQHLTSRGQLSDAALVAAAADEGSILCPSDKPRHRRLGKFHTEDHEQRTRCNSCVCIFFKLETFSGYWHQSTDEKLVNPPSKVARSLQWSRQDGRPPDEPGVSISVECDTFSL